MPWNTNYCTIEWHTDVQQVAFHEIQTKCSKSVGILGQYTRSGPLQIVEFSRHFWTCYSCFSSEIIKIHPKLTVPFCWIRFREWSCGYSSSFWAHIFNFIIFHWELSEEWHSTCIQDLYLFVLWKSRMQRTLNTLNGQADIFLIFSCVFSLCSNKKRSKTVENWLRTNLNKFCVAQIAALAGAPQHVQTPVA